MRVCVLGAGIVGLATAYALTRQGHDVTVLDQAPAPGAGASGGNGAQLSYSYVAPLADASIWAQLPHLLLSPHSPLKLRPQWDVAQWRWGIEFLRACNQRTAAASTAQLLALAALSRQGLEAMMDAEALPCDFSRTGKLVLYGTPSAFAAAQRQLELQRRWGCAQEAVSTARCHEIEPALLRYQGHIAGAIYTPSECAADCLQVCEGLHRVLQAQGVRFVLGVQALGFRVSGQQAPRVDAVRTAAGDVAADAFVLALGSASPALVRPLGLRLPVYPLKGYSITLDVQCAPELAAPRVSVTDAQRKVVFARLGHRVRVAGMAELVGHDRRIPADRIQTLRRATRAVFPALAVPDDASVQPWMGMRPATPTGLPIVGRHARGPRNLLLNTGHGSLGFTLAFGTAAQVVQALADSPAA